MSTATGELGCKYPQIPANNRYIYREGGREGARGGGMEGERGGVLGRGRRGMRQSDPLFPLCSLFGVGPLSKTGRDVISNLYHSSLIAAIAVSRLLLGVQLHQSLLHWPHHLLTLHRPVAHNYDTINRAQYSAIPSHFQHYKCNH